MTTPHFSSITPRKFASLACRSTLASRGAASIWAPRPYASPASKPGSKRLATTLKMGQRRRSPSPRQKKEGDPNAKYLKEITATCTKQAELVMKTLEAGKSRSCWAAIIPSRQAPSPASPSSIAARTRSIGLIWIDAHTDINTPDTSPSGNVHGMPLARHHGPAAPPLANIYDFSPKVRPENCVLVGIRDVDAHEKENIRRAGVDVFTMRDIDERGMRTVMEEALRIAGRGTAGYHVSLDMDWIDPEDAPGVGTPVWGGATYREAHLAMEIIADHGRMLSFEIVEVNPVIDEHNQTADLAVELALSAFREENPIGTRSAQSAATPGCAKISENISRRLSSSSFCH